MQGPCPKAEPRRCVAAGLVLAAVVLGPTFSSAANRVLLKSGDAAVDGEGLNSFASPVAGGRASIAFLGSTGAVMIRSGDVFRVIARTGDPLPAPLSGTFNSFCCTVINEGGAVAFRARLNSADADQGIFLHRDGRFVPVVLEGGLRGTAQGLIGHFLNDASDVVYADGEAVTLWRFASATGTAVAANGGPAPGGGTFFGFGRPVLNDAGMVAFAAETTFGDGA